MSSENVETIRAAYEAVSRGDWDSAFSEAHPDFEWTPADRHPLAGTYRGAEEVRRFFEDLREAFEEVRAEPERFFECGDRILVFVLMRYRPEGTSATIDVRIGHLWTMRDGKAVRCETFPERDKALEAAGVKE